MTAHMAYLGTAPGGTCAGSFWLPKAGLLDGCRRTLYWENAKRFLVDFPKVTASTRLYETDRDRYACNGGIASVDMMLISASWFGQIHTAPGSTRL